MGEPRRRGSARERAEDQWQVDPSRPPLSREARQARMEDLALDLVERRLRSGEASAQETTHYLKSASTRGKIEELKMKHEIELLQAKKKQIESAEELQNLFTAAMAAFTTYRIEPPDGADDVPPHLQ